MNERNGGCEVIISDFSGFLYISNSILKLNTTLAFGTLGKNIASTTNTRVHRFSWYVCEFACVLVICYLLLPLKFKIVCSFIVGFVGIHLKDKQSFATVGRKCERQQMSICVQHTEQCRPDAPEMVTKRKCFRKNI